MSAPEATRREIEALGIQLAERAVGLARAYRTAELRGAAATAAQAEAVTLRDELATLRDELAARDAALAETAALTKSQASTIEALEARLAEHDVALASAKRLAELRGAAAQMARTELAALQTRVAASKGTLAEPTIRADEAEAGLISAQAEVCLLRAAQETGEGSAALRAARDQIAALQQQLASTTAALADAERLAAERIATPEAAEGEHALLPSRDAALAKIIARAETAEHRLELALAERAQADAALARAQQNAELRGAAAEAAQAEAAGLRDELAARNAALALSADPKIGDPELRAGARPV